MRHSLIVVTVAGALASITPARAQVSLPSATPQWPFPQQAYGGTYQPLHLLNAPTPGEAYKQGLINRWELERYEGPTPQALQGPSPNGGNAAPGAGGM